jgi:hypothetical protein
MYVLYDKHATWEKDYILRDLIPSDLVARTLMLDVPDMVALATLPPNHPYIGNCILVFSSNLFQYHVIVPIIQRIKPRVVIHLSDEFATAPEMTDIAYCTPLYLRQYMHADYPQYENMHQIPLGYMSGMLGGLSSIDAVTTVPVVSDRKYPWAFIGNPKQDRSKMIATFDRAIPNGYTATGKTAREMYTIYRDTIFVPSGRGNCSLDCFRVYEAIVSGAIPVIVGPEAELAVAFEYSGKRPPCIYAETWEDAALRCSALRCSAAKGQLETMQADLRTWWQGQIDDIRKKIRNLI